MAEITWEDMTTGEVITIWGLSIKAILDSFYTEENTYSGDYTIIDAYVFES